jgi:transcriptional regulator with XRE-family HTH domain
MNKQDIGLFIKTERTKQELSQKALAEKAGLTRYQQIIEIESCSVNYGVDSLIKVLNALGYVPRFKLIDNKEPVAMLYDFSKIESAVEEPEEETVGKLNFKRKK